MQYKLVIDIPDAYSTIKLYGNPPMLFYDKNTKITVNSNFRNPEHYDKPSNTQPAIIIDSKKIYSGLPNDY